MKPTFKKLETAFVAIFERDTNTPWKSSGSFLPEVELEYATIGCAIEAIGIHHDMFGKAYIAKLQYVTHEDACYMSESDLVICTGNGGVDDNPIIWEKCGTSLPSWYLHTEKTMLMSGESSEIKLMKIVGVEEFTTPDKDYFSEDNREIKGRKFIRSGKAGICIHGVKKSESCDDCFNDVPF